MPAKISEQDWIDRIAKAGESRYRFVRWDGEFKGKRSKAVCRCEIDGYEWSATASSLLDIGTGCPQCGGQRRWTADERIGQINAKPGIRFVRWDGEFKGNRSRAICTCEIDGYEWSVCIRDFVNTDQGCPQCAGNRKLTADERIGQINAKPGIRFVRWDGEFKGKRSRAICRCEIDGCEWSASVNHLIHSGSGCPYCARYGKTDEQPAPNVTVEIPTDIKPAFDLLNW